MEQRKHGQTYILKGAIASKRRVAEYYTQRRRVAWWPARESTKRIKHTVKVYHEKKEGRTYQLTNFEMKVTCMLQKVEAGMRFIVNRNYRIEEESEERVEESEIKWGNMD